MGWLYSNKWAAGFFDGEGNIYLRQRERRRVRDVYAQITQKDRRPLEEFQKRWGGSLTETKTPSDCYRWRVSHQKAEAFLLSIHRYLLVKDEAVREALIERSKVRPYRRRKV